MLIRTTIAIISCITMANMASAQESNMQTNVDYKNDISLSVSNVVGNDLYNGTGPAIVYRKWIKPNLAVKIGAGVDFYNYYNSHITYKVDNHTISNIRNTEDQFYYVMLGFEAKKQVFKNFAIYYGANIQIGAMYSESQNYRREENYENNKYTSHTYNHTSYSSSGFQTTFTPVVGVKYQFLKRMELGTELRTFNFSTYMSSGNSTLDVNAQFNANMYLSYRFGKRKN